jgi:hypothetical protein
VSDVDECAGAGTPVDTQALIEAARSRTVIGRICMVHLGSVRKMVPLLDGITVALHISGGHQMADEKRTTETETKTKHDMMGNPKEQKTTTKEKDVDSSGNKSETKTEFKEKR